MRGHLDNRAPTPPRVFWVPFFAVFLSRLPFVGLDYGVEPDGWRVALSAARIAATGVYSPSRLGSNPIHEMSVALLGGGVWAVTLLSALAAALAAGGLARIIWRIRGGQSVWLGIALGFVPVVFIASTGGKDYVWTLAALVWCTWFALEDRPIRAGLALGVAIGCRLSVAPMGLIPLLLVAGRAAPQRNIQVAKLVGFSALTTGLAYFPVVRAVGWDFMGYTWAPALTMTRFVDKGLLQVWGLVGLLGWAAAAASALRLTNPPAIFVDRSLLAGPGWRWTAWSLGLLVPASLFLIFPSHAGYWIPAIPFVILIAAERLTRGAALVLAGALIISPFIMGVRPVNTHEAIPLAWGRTIRSAHIEYLRGPILYDQARRRARLRIARQTLVEIPSLPSEAVVVAGAWHPMLQTMTSSSSEVRNQLRYDLSAAELTTTSTRAIYYFMPGVLRNLESRLGVRSATYGRPLPSGAP